MLNTDATTSTCDMIPSAYLQKSFPSSNSYMWLSTFCSAFNWSNTSTNDTRHVRKKSSEVWMVSSLQQKRVGPISLYGMLKFIPDMNLALCRETRCKDSKSSLTEYILKKKE